MCPPYCIGRAARREVIEQTSEEARCHCEARLYPPSTRFLLVHTELRAGATSSTEDAARVGVVVLRSSRKRGTALHRYRTNAIQSAENRWALAQVSYYVRATTVDTVDPCFMFCKSNLSICRVEG